jgi:hypothetical protein
VTVSTGKTGRVGLYKNQKPEEIARNFAKVYSLNKEKE